MAAFDPSALQDIQPPNIVGGIVKGFQLKDLMDTTQLNDMKLKQERQSMSDQDTTRSILSKSKLDTPEGLAEASEKLTRAGQPDKAMELRKMGMQIQSGELDLKLKQIDFHAATQDIIAGGIDQLWTQAKNLKDAKTADGRPRYTDASINAVITGQIPLLIDNITNDQTLPAEAKQQALKQIHGYIASGQPVTFDTLSQLEQVSKQGQAHIKAARDDLTARMGIKNQESEIAHRGVEERQNQEKIDLQKKNADSFGGENSALLAALVEKGVPLPAGFRSKAQQRATLDGLRARNPGKSMDEIAELVGSGQISFGAERKETQTAAGIAGRVSVGENELLAFAPKALAISDKVARGDFVPFTRLQQIGSRNISDPDMKELYGRTNAILNSYDIIAARGGTDKDKRRENRQALETADSPAAYRRAVETMMDEARLAKGAARKAEGRDTAPSAADPLGIR